MRENVPFREIPFGDFFVNVAKNRMWMQSMEEFQLEGKFLSLHLHICRVKLGERIYSLAEKSVIHCCELRGYML